MTYGTKEVVRTYIGLEPTDSAQDIEVDRALTWADTYIDSTVAAVGGTVPETVPNAIKRASEDLAAFNWHRTKNPTTATLFYNTGMDMLHNWIASQYGQSIVKEAGAAD